MHHALIFTILITGSISGGAVLAAENPANAPPANPSSTQVVMTEAYFLQQADNAVKAGDVAAAVQLYQSAIIYAPADPVPYQKLGDFFARSGQVELAQQYYGLALDVQPAYAPAVQGLAALQQMAAGQNAGAANASP